MRIRIASFAAVLALTASTLMLAPPAQASTGSFSGGVLTVSLSASDWFRVQEAYDAPGTYLVISDLGNGPASIPGCTTVAEDYFRCVGVNRVVLNGSTGDDQLTVSGYVSAEVRGGAGDDEILVGATTATLQGGSGDDTISVEMAPGATSGATIDGGDGNDMVIGSDLAETIRGGAGDDELFGGDGDDRIFGDGGHDWLVGEDGNDTLDGGDGNDRLTGMAGADTYRGGPGADTADYWDQYAGQSNVHLSASLDGKTNDGAVGESDNIDADGSVENIDSGDLNFTLESVTLIGDDGPNILDGYSPSAMTAHGRGGDDLITVRSMSSSGRTTVTGGAGDDVIKTDGEITSIDGGPGNDTINGGRGDDSIVGGPGADSINSGPGNDTINAADGEVDRIACGTGADVLRADTGDVVNQDPSELCESITRVTGSTGGKLTVKLRAKARVSKRGTVAFKVSNGLKKPVKLRVVAKIRKMTFGKGAVTVKPGRSGKLVLKLTKAGKKRLNKTGSVRAKVTVRAVSGTTLTRSRTVRFLKN